MGMGGCCRWGWLVRQGDTPEEARITTVMFPFTILVFLYMIVLIVNRLRNNNQMVVVVGNVTNAFAFLLFMGGVLWTAIPAGFLLDAVLGLCTVGVCARDLGNATMSYSFRGWTFVVLLLDIALVFKRYHMPRFIMPFVLVYLVALQVESVSRFGLYEAGYWGTEGVEISHCNCASPPCDSTPVDAVVTMVS
eukprot:Hpha_TRINITY_DN15707_c1_g9::TRINITY_DN15707_c1_g9_i3::g.39415::m.39415